MNTVAKYLCALLLSGVALTANALVIQQSGPRFAPGLPVHNAVWSGPIVLTHQAVPADFSFFLGGHHGGHIPVVPLQWPAPFSHPHWQAAAEVQPPAAVWEPSAGKLMLLGFAMLILVRWRQSRINRLQDSAA